MTITVLDLMIPGAWALLILLPVSYILWELIGRVDRMTPQNSRSSWRWLNINIAIWCAWVAADAMAHWALHLRALYSMLIIAGYLWLTRGRWAAGVPEPVAQFDPERTGTA